MQGDTVRLGSLCVRRKFFSFFGARLAQDEMNVVMVYAHPHSKDWKENPHITNLQIILNSRI